MENTARFGEYSFDLAEVDFIQERETQVDGDKALKLIIHFRSGKEISLQAIIAFKRKVVEGQEVGFKSEYPIDKLKSIINKWRKFKEKSVRATPTEIVRVIEKGNGQVETIHETITEGGGK